MIASSERIIAVPNIADRVLIINITSEFHGWRIRPSVNAGSGDCSFDLRQSRIYRCFREGAMGRRRSYLPLLMEREAATQLRAKALETCRLPSLRCLCRVLGRGRGRIVVFLGSRLHRDRQDCFRRRVRLLGGVVPHSGPNRCDR